MTSVVRTAALRRAAVRATSAPSVYNTQPWALRLHGDQLDLYVDRARGLTTLDPRGRQLTISCGAALFNARASLAADGVDTHVDRFPDDRDAQHAARITALGDQRPRSRSRVSLSMSLAMSLASPATPEVLNDFVEARRANRHEFTEDQVPAGVLAVLARAVEAEHGELVVVDSPEDRAVVVAIARRAGARLLSDPGYLAEAKGWGQRRSTASQDPPGDRGILIIAVAGDGPLDWLRAGEALERLLLETTRQGFVADPIAQSIVADDDRHALRVQLEMTVTPQVVLRVGHAPVSLATRRRRLVDVLTEQR